ncbi:chondroitin sulfate N-acetylgalactosaminyltransferase 2-like isoform X2 [Panulirus ornatus]|uniref:chondroitin sulfate N-acetylgalactosaminyltransferase 2-like isoform X2 n=1 Tax=Panulirus ornatus TaxID=150431 RepID=UPI003A858966
MTQATYHATSPTHQAALSTSFSPSHSYQVTLTKEGRRLERLLTRMKQGRHKLVFLVKLHFPMLWLCLRLLLFLLVSVVLLVLLLHQAVGVRAMAPLWNPFSKLRNLTTSRWAVRHGQEEGSQDDQEILNKDPNFPRIRDWMFDHIYFSFYDGARVYTNQASTSGVVTRSPRLVERRMLSEVHERALGYLNSKYPARYKREHCTSTRYRTVPTVGLEVDVTCQEAAAHTDRVTLLVPFRSPQVLYHHNLPPHASLNIIMPLQGRYQTVQVFLENLRSVLTSGAMPLVGLTMVYFDDDQTQKVRDLLQATSEQVPNLQTEFILLDKKYKFSRGRGLQEGVERTTLKGEVLFFCDVDAFFTREFLTRCLTTPVQGHQVYTPMLFSLYNPEFVYTLYGKKVPPPLEQLRVHDDYGFWRLWGFGMVCLYKSDFLKFDGFDKQRTQWGGEDINFHTAIVKNRHFKIIRSLDPGLFHLYHPKTCGNARSSSPCFKTKALNEGSQFSLAMWYMHQMENLSVHSVLTGVEHLQLLDTDFDPEAEARVEAEDGTQRVREGLCVLLVVFVFLFNVCLSIHNYKRYVKISKIVTE